MNLSTSIITQARLVSEKASRNITVAVVVVLAQLRLRLHNTVSGHSSYLTRLNSKDTRICFNLVDIFCGRRPTAED